MGERASEQANRWMEGGESEVGSVERENERSMDGGGRVEVGRVEDGRARERNAEYLIGLPLLKVSRPQ
jgi:hypothetical protein